MTEVLVQIRDVERDQIVGQITTDGELETDDELLEEEWEEFRDGVPMISPVKYEESVGYDEHVVEPDSDGFARAVLDELPSPFFVDNRDRLDELPLYGPEDGPNT